MLDLTKRAEYSVGKAISDRQLPLRCNDQAECRDEEEVCDKDIVRGNSSPFHQAQRESRQRCSERP